MIWKTTDGGLRDYLRHFDTEDLVIRESWFDTCPCCASLNTRQIEGAHRFSSIETTRACDNCGKVWVTKVFSEPYYWDSDDLEDEYEDSFYLSD